MSTYSFITAPYRWVDHFDATIRESFDLARQLELPSAVSNINDADVLAETLFDILKSPRVRFEVPVVGVNVIMPSMYSGVVPFPCATLYSDRFGLSGGRVVLVPEYAVNLNEGQTVLRCWG